MQKGGRPRDPIWTLFEESHEKTKMKCISCHTYVSRKADRMKTHLKKCSFQAKAPVAVSEQIAPVQIPWAAEKVPASDECLAPPRQMQQTLLGHVVSTPVQTKDKIDQSIAEFFYGCNLPFAVVEHPKFKAMVESLRTGYKLPTRKTMGGPLLNQTHSKLQSVMKEKLQGKTVTMQQDGWSTLHNVPSYIDLHVL